MIVCIYKYIRLIKYRDGVYISRYTVNQVQGKHKILILDDFDLIDVWRERHGGKNRFIWKQNSPPVKCTLDYWFIPSVFAHEIKNIEIKPALRSDHLAVCISICHDKVVKGNGYWKFNHAWLNNGDYVSTLNKLIDDCIGEYSSMLSPKHLWDLCKTKIRSFTIDFAKGSQKEHRNAIY